MNIRKHKCPVCPKKYTMSSSLSRHITDMVKKGDKAHMEHRGVKPKAEPLPLHPEATEDSPRSFASPPSVKREDETETETEPGPSDDLDQLKLPGPEEEPDYVPPAGVDAIPAMAEVPYDNWQSVLEYAGNTVEAIGSGDIDSLTTMGKKDYEIMAKDIATRRGADLSTGQAAAIIYAKFVVFCATNAWKGIQRGMAKRREKMAKKAEEEKKAQEKVKEDD